MIKVSKTDAFNLVAKALENDDEKSANDILQIISKSILKDSNQLIFSPYIENKDKKEIKVFKSTAPKYGLKQVKEQDA